MCQYFVHPGGCREGVTIRRGIQCCRTFFSCTSHHAPYDVAAWGWTVWVRRAERADAVGDATTRHFSLGVAARVWVQDDAA